MAGERRGLLHGSVRTLFEAGIPRLRPGMTARVEILVAVKTADGKIDGREVTLDLSTDKEVEVKAGLNPGESVALDPVPLLSDEQRRKARSPQPPAEPVKDKN